MVRSLLCKITIAKENLSVYNAVWYLMYTDRPVEDDEIFRTLLPIFLPFAGSGAVFGAEFFRSEM